jgi:dihydroxy-acid dehydratase
MSFDPKHKSHILTNGRDRAPARSRLKAIGFTDEDLRKPIIGVCHEWIETMPCNFNHRNLAAKVKEGIRTAGATPMEFNTISISDGVTMGTEGMKASLVSRELIAALQVRRVSPVRRAGHLSFRRRDYARRRGVNRAAAKHRLLQ